MQCRVCGSQIPLGASACPVCGTPVAQQEQNGGQIPPTVYSPQPGQAPTGYGAGSFDQPPPPNPNAYGQSGSNYSSPSYDQYNQTDATQYAPPPNQSNYNQPPNYNQPNYNQPNYNQPNQQGYGVPPAPNNFNNNQYGNNVPPYAPQVGQQYGAPQQPPRRRSPWLWIILGIVVVVILACAGGTYAIVKAGSNASQTKSSTATATQATPTSGDVQTIPTSPQATPTVGSNPSNTGSTPSGDPIDSTAAQIITDPQTATAVDDNTAAAQPGSVTSNFKTNQDIYVVFKLNLSGVDLNSQTLYVSARFYADGAKVFSAKPLKLIQTTGGYFGAQYYVSTQQGAAELVLCKQSDCSDAKVGQVVQFTVSD
jgi:hypothetical protein